MCFNTIFTTFLSMALLGRGVLRHEWFGLALTVIGAFLVSIARVEGPSDTGHIGGWSVIAGLLLIVIAHFWYALEFVVAERLLSDHEISAFVSVGVMGGWGVGIFVPLLAVLRMTPSTPETYAPLWHEDISQSVATLAQQPSLLVTVVAQSIMLIVFNAAAFKTTELCSALSRIFLSQLVPPLIWILDLSLGWYFGASVGAAEQLSAWSALQLCGFVLIVSGTLLYNNVCGRFENRSSPDAEPLLDVRCGSC